jgi:hypothetical protein
VIKDIKKGYDFGDEMRFHGGVHYKIDIFPQILHV